MHDAVLRTNVGRRLDRNETGREAMLEAIRDTDLLMVHLSDYRTLARLIATEIMTTSVLERFPPLRPDRHARRRARRARCPTTPGQLALLRMLVDELQALGLADAAMDEHGYVMATIPATTGPRPTCR